MNCESELTELKTPVVFIIFNRPETTQKVFAEIEKAKPKKLFITADASRDNMKDELELCQKTKKVVEQINWPCEVSKNYAASNMGCRDRIISGLDWVFDQVEEAIILEDDCVPTQSYFLFCQAMLEKYQNDTRVSLVNGFRPPIANNNDRLSVEFTRVFLIWGWATWGRVWRAGKFLIDDYVTSVQSKKALHNYFSKSLIRKNMQRIFYKFSVQNIPTTWDILIKRLIMN